MDLENHRHYVQTMYNQYIELENENKSLRKFYRSLKMKDKNRHNNNQRILNDGWSNQHNFKQFSKNSMTNSETKRQPHNGYYGYIRNNNQKPRHPAPRRAQRYSCRSEINFQGCQNMSIKSQNSLKEVCQCDILRNLEERLRKLEDSNFAAAWELRFQKLECQVTNIFLLKKIRRND